MIVAEGHDRVEVKRRVTAQGAAVGRRGALRQASGAPEAALPHSRAELIGTFRTQQTTGRPVGPLVRLGFAPDTPWRKHEVGHAAHDPGNTPPFGACPDRFPKSRQLKHLAGSPPVAKTALRVSTLWTLYWGPARNVRVANVPKNRTFPFLSVNRWCNGVDGWFRMSQQPYFTHAPGNSAPGNEASRISLRTEPAKSRHTRPKSPK